jgi:hypothetical protein
MWLQPNVPLTKLTGAADSHWTVIRIDKGGGGQGLRNAGPWAYCRMYYTAQLATWHCCAIQHWFRFRCRFVLHHMGIDQSVLPWKQYLKAWLAVLHKSRDRMPQHELSTPDTHVKHLSTADADKCMAFHTLVDTHCGSVTGGAGTSGADWSIQLSTGCTGPGVMQRVRLLPALLYRRVKLNLRCCTVVLGTYCMRQCRMW